MITLDFQIDEDELAADLAASPEAANPAAVEQTYFVMPVRFAVGETDFLAFPGVYDRWRPQPLLGIATHLVLALQAIKPGQPSRCNVADGGRLDFEQFGATIAISSSVLPGQIANVPAGELIGAASRFRDEVRDFLAERVPAMTQHPYWKTWFPD
jgi:hypothetical protein